MFTIVFILLLLVIIIGIVLFAFICIRSGFDNKYDIHWDNNLPPIPDEEDLSDNLPKSSWGLRKADYLELDMPYLDNEVNTLMGLRSEVFL